MLSEPELIIGIRKGEKRALRDLYDHFAPILLGICMRYCSNRSDAEDVMHDALIKILSHISTFEEKHAGSFEGWIRAITVNTALNFLREKAKHNRLLIPGTDENTAVSEPEDQSVQDDLLEKISSEDVLDMICGLPVGYRLVFNLYVFEGKSHREIAEMCGCSENTSKTQLFKARAWLRNRISDTLKQMK